MVYTIYLVHFIKSIKNTLLIGSITGCLLATTSWFWQHGETPFLLPILVACWWLVIFGCSLWLAYSLSNTKISTTRGFALQLIHALVAVLIYGGIDFFQNGIPAKTAEVLQNAPTENLTASLFEVDTHPVYVIPVAFVLCVVTSGLLFSILNKPSTK